MKEYSFKKYLMWYKVNELKEKSYTISQISRELSLDRKTVRRYLSLSSDEFISSSLFERKVEPKLSIYQNDILSLLEECSDFSSSQIHDRLREKYSNFLPVHRNTVNRYVQRLRLENNIPKRPEQFRQYSHLPDCEYGEYAQVDFGERWIYTKDHKRHKKIYFMVMLLSRSRYKYIYAQTTPFTTKTSNYAHELAFKHFGGVPRNIIYDQDKVLIYRENLGDYILVNEFSSFHRKFHFKPIFCRKSDPESKGKVENVVKYVKYNFLKGRRFTDIDTLNAELLSWMDRTANGLAHGTTKLIPKKELDIETSYLLPYNGTPVLENEVMLTYKVLKDNTINYRSNFYSVPLGTYQGADTKVYITISGSELIIYNQETGKTITQHELSIAKGKLISHPEHRKRDRSSIIELEKNIISEFNNNENVKLYLDGINQTKPRYYLDNLRHLNRNLDSLNKDNAISMMIYHMNNNIYNTDYLLTSLNIDNRDLKDNKSDDKYSDLKPETRSINSYNVAL